MSTSTGDSGSIDRSIESSIWSSSSTELTGFSTSGSYWSVSVRGASIDHSPFSAACQASLQQTVDRDAGG
jgi:hypothetical protein